MDEKSLQKTIFDGHTVYYDDGALQGLRYLRDSLDTSETRVFFDQARLKGSASFEDLGGNNYTLQKNADGTYTIIRR